MIIHIYPFSTQEKAIATTTIANDMHSKYFNKSQTLERIDANKYWQTTENKQHDAWNCKLQIETQNILHFNENHQAGVALLLDRTCFQKQIEKYAVACKILKYIFLAVYFCSKLKNCRLKTAERERGCI